MSYLSLPQTFTGANLIFTTPQKASGSAAVKAQIRNASPWVITVMGLFGQSMIDPFTAATIDVALGQSIVCVGSLNVYTTLPNGYIAIEWLLTNETSNEPDGPLTANATVSSLLSNVISVPPNGIIISSGVSSGTAMDCSQFEQVLIQISGNTPGTSTVVFSEIGGLSINPQSFPIDCSGTGGNVIVFQIPVLGPLVTVNVPVGYLFAVLGIPKGATANITGVGMQDAFRVNNDPLAGNGTNTYQPSVSVPGRYHVWFNCGQSCLLAFDRWVQNKSNFQLIHRALAGGTNTGYGCNGNDYDIDIYIPYADWRARVINQTAVATADYITLTGPY